MRISRTRATVATGAVATGVLGALLLAAPTAQAAFLGLDPGDVIDTIGFTIGGGGASFDDSANTLDIIATADDVQTTTPETLTEISGGQVAIYLEVVSETLTPVFGSLYSYQATLIGQASVSDHVTISAPTGGPAPEQDGRLLVSGDLASSPTVTLSVPINIAGGGPGSFTATGTFDVTGGDPLFAAAFGGLGSLADVLAASTSSVPSLATLFSDGYLFSQRDVVLGSGAGQCGGGGDCVGSITGTQDWSASGTGQIDPVSPAAFVPEPGTFFLLSSGLLGIAIQRRRAGR